MNKISEHITYRECIRSDVAKRNGINNYFNLEQLDRMRVLAEKVFEPLREHFGVPIFISSFFRTAQLNKLLGGAKGSQHMANNGAAIDLDADVFCGITNKDIFNYVKDNLEFDQLIYEDVKADGSAGWVHVSYNEGKNRRQVLTMTLKDGKQIYSEYGT